MTDPIKIVLQDAFQDGNPVVKLFVPYDQEVIDLIRRNTKACWSPGLRCWIIKREDFFRAFHDRKLEEISHGEINDYILELIKENRISRSQQNQRINAIKFYYEKVIILPEI